MVKLFVVLGLALLLGGSYAIVDGWPYLVLERGFTEVILGAVAATAGLILLALAAVLAEVRRLKGVVGGAMALMSLAEPRPATPSTAAAAAPVLDEPLAAPAETGGSKLAPTLVAGAGALAVGAALGGLAGAGERQGAASHDPALHDPAQEETGRAAGETAREDADAPATPEWPGPALREDDDWLRPIDEAPEPPAAAALPGEDPAGAAAEAVPDRDDVEPALDLLPASLSPGPVAAEEPAEIVAVTGFAETRPEAEAEPDTNAAGGEPEPWWPRHDAPVAEDSIADEFSALRAELSGFSREIAGAAPDVEPPRRDSAVDGDWMAPRPWPPVTLPRSLETLPEPEPAESPAAPEAVDDDARTEEAPDPAVAADAQAAVAAAAVADLPDEPAEMVDIAADGDAAPAAAAAADDEAATEPLKERPPASEEGVIGAYQVGETQFTMYADGSIHARTPDGDYVFASMDELKTYLASEKNRLDA